jgi:hypothetical protein
MKKMLENLGLITLVPFGLHISTTHNLFMHLIIEFLKINTMNEINQTLKEKMSS